MDPQLNYGNNPYFTAGGSFGGPSDPMMLKLEMLNANRIAPFQTFQPSGLTGFSTFGAGPMSQMGGLMVNQLVSGMAGPGYVMGNAFGAMSSGFLPSMQARNDAIQMRMAMRGGAANDTQSLQALALGAFTIMNGGQQTEDIRNKARAYGGELGSAISSPMGMMSLMMLSQASGFDFAGWLAPTQTMNYNLFRAGMGTYRGDGRFGLSGDEAAGVGRGLADFYRPGGRYDYSRTRGFNLGEIGGLALDLQARGLGAGFREGVDDNDSEVQAEFVATRRAHGGILNSSMRQSAMDHIRAKRVIDRTSDYLPALQVMSEMSGGQGTPGELMQGVQSLTGGLGLVDPKELESRLSKIREVSRVAGLTLGVMADVIKNGMAMAQAAGLTEAAGSTMAVDSVLAAHTSVQLIQGNSNYYGRPTTEGVASFYQQKHIGAARSAMGQSLGASMAVLLDRAGGDRSKLAGMVKGNPLLEQLLNVANGGQASEGFYQQTAGVQGVQNLSEAIAQATGASAQDVRGMLSNPGMAQQGLAEFDSLISGIQGMQTLSQDRRISARLQSSAGIRSAIAKFHIKDVGGFTRDLADAAVAPGNEQENARLAELAKKYGISVNDIMALKLPADEEAMREFGNATALHAAGALRYGQAEIQKARIFMASTNSVGAALRAKGIGSAGFTDRLISLVQGLGDNANQDLTAFVAQALGDVKRSDIGDAVRGQVIELANLRKQLADPNLDPKKKAELRAKEQGLSHALMNVFQTQNSDDFVKDVRSGAFGKQVDAAAAAVSKEIADAGGVDAYDKSHSGKPTAADPVKVEVVGGLFKNGQLTAVLQDSMGNNIGQILMHAAANVSPGVAPSTHSGHP